MCDELTLSKVKTALRVDDEEFDGEIRDLIESALVDLNLSGADGEKVLATDPAVRVAVITYCKLHWGECSDYQNLKQSYDEKKANLSMSTGYTRWTGQQ